MSKIRTLLQFSILNNFRIMILPCLAVVVTPMWQVLGRKMTNSETAWTTV